MQEQPKRLKYKRSFKRVVSLKSISFNNATSKLKIGAYGLKLKETCKLQVFQLRGLKTCLNFHCKKSAISWFPNAHFNIPLTKKSIGVRMGKGKGKIKNWCANFYKGTILAEFELPNSLKGFKALKDILNKVPAKVILVKRTHLWLDKISSKFLTFSPDILFNNFLQLDFQQNYFNKVDFIYSSSADWVYFFYCFFQKRKLKRWLINREKRRLLRENIL